MFEAPEDLCTPWKVSCSLEPLCPESWTHGPPSHFAAANTLQFPELVSSEQRGAFSPGWSIRRRKPPGNWVCVMRCLSPGLGCEVTETLTEAFGAAFLIDMCFRILQRNRSRRGDLLWESAPKIMEAEKSHDAPSAGWRTGKAGGIIQS